MAWWLHADNGSFFPPSKPPSLWPKLGAILKLSLGRGEGAEGLPNGPNPTVVVVCKVANYFSFFITVYC